MATLNIEGRKVSVDDSFLTLSPDQQNATVEEIAKSLMPSAAAEPSVLSQAAAAAPTLMPKSAPPASGGGIADTIHAIREAVHAPTRILENNFLFGLGDRARAGMGAIIGEGGYADNLKREQAETEKYDHEHPVASTGIGLVGGAAAPIGAIGAASKGADLITKSLLGAGAGGVIGGLQGITGSKDWTNGWDTAKNALIGTGLGAGTGLLLPGIAQGIGWGVRTVADAVRGRATGMSRGATQHLANAIEADGGIPAVKAKMAELGPEAMLLDAGESLKTIGQGSNLTTNEARAMTSARLQARDDATNARIREDVNNTLGRSEDPAIATRNIVDYRSRVDNQNYPRVLQAAPPVRTAPLMVELDDAILSAPNGSTERRALENLQGMLTREQMMPRLEPHTGRQMLDNRGQPMFDRTMVNQDRAEVLHKVKQELDNVIEHELPGLGVQAGALRNQQFQLKRFRHDLNQALEDQVQGYARANRVSQRLAERAEAVKAGTGYLGEGKTTPSPERFLDEHELRDVGTRIAFGKGSRGEIDRLIGTKANDLEALKSALRGEGSWNAQKLATVHGQEATDALLASVDRNAHFRENFRAIVKNSQTAQRTAAKEALQPTVFKPNDIVAPNNPGAGMILSALKLGGTRALNIASGEHNINTLNELARIVSEKGAARDTHIAALADAMRRRGQNGSISRGAVDAGLVGAASLANSLVDAQRRKLR